MSSVIPSAPASVPRYKRQCPSLMSVVKFGLFAVALLSKGSSAENAFDPQENTFGSTGNGVGAYNPNAIYKGQPSQAFLQSICNENDGGPRRTLQATRHISSDIYCQLLDSPITIDNVEEALGTGGNFDLSDDEECDKADYLYFHIQNSGHGDYANCSAYRKRAEIAISKKNDPVTIECLSHMQNKGIMFTGHEEQAYSAAIRRTSQRNRMMFRV